MNAVAKMTRICAISRTTKSAIIACSKCGSTDFGFWTSSGGRTRRYCRACRRVRAVQYAVRRARNGGQHTLQEWLAKLRSYIACPRCGRHWQDIPSRPNSRYRTVWTKDHIRPLSVGGTDDIDNIQPLCYQCNFSKGGKNDRTTGRYLNVLWRVEAEHALYHDVGKWYHQIERFPGALFDRNGYIMFSDKAGYEKSPYLIHGKNIHVPEGIERIPGYVRVRTITAKS